MKTTKRERVMAATKRKRVRCKASGCRCADGRGCGCAVGDWSEPSLCGGAAWSHPRDPLRPPLADPACRLRSVDARRDLHQHRLLIPPRSTVSLHGKRRLHVHDGMGRLRARRALEVHSAFEVRTLAVPAISKAKASSGEHVLAQARHPPQLLERRRVSKIDRREGRQLGREGGFRLKNRRSPLRFYKLWQSPSGKLARSPSRS